MRRRYAVLLVLVLILGTGTSCVETRAEEVPSFTDKDLERYRGALPVSREPLKHRNDKKSLSRSGKEPYGERILATFSQAVAVVVTYTRKGEPLGHGSGFVARNDGAIVTSYHVVSGAASIRVKVNNEVYTVDGLLHVDRQNDIAILKVDGNNLPTLLLGDSDTTKVKEKIYVLSIPTGTEHVLTEGRIRATRILASNRRILQIDTTLSKGSSGAPVFNTRDEVIGIATSTVYGTLHLSYAVPINSIRYDITNTRVIPLRDVLENDYSKSAEYWLTVADSLTATGRYSNAVDAYKKALEINPDAASAYNGLGVAYANSRKYRDAEKAFKKALEREPDSALTHNNLGLVYSEKGKYKKALEEFEQAISIQPDLAVAYLNLGLAYRGLRKYSSAAEAFRRAVAIHPDLPDAHYNLGITYLDMNDKDAALEEQKVLMNISPLSAERLLRLIER